MTRTVMTVPILALALVVGNGGAAPAQAVTPPGTGQLSGTMTDVISGKIIIRGRVCLNSIPGHMPREYLKCASTDSTGHYMIDGIVAARLQARAWCTGQTGMIDRALGTAQMVFGSVTRHRWNVVATIDACDQRPLERITGEFTGYHYSAFETTWFFVDNRPEIYATADYTATYGLVNPTVMLPNYRPKYDEGCYRQTLEGELSGPYGRFGRPIDRFLLVVTRVLHGQQVEMERCDQRVDRVVPRNYEEPPDPTVDVIVTYLEARHAFTGERLAVVMCADVVEAIRPGERDRLSQEAAGFVSSYNVAERCDDAPPPTGDIPNLVIQEYSGKNSYGGGYPAVRAVRTAVDGTVLIERFIKHVNANRLEYSAPNPP